MPFSRNALNVISVVMAIVMLNSCVMYSKGEVPKEKPEQYANRVLNLTWPGAERKDLYMTDFSVTENALTGAVQALERDPYNRKNPRVTVHLNFTDWQPPTLPGVYSIPISDISKIEVYDVDIAGSIVSSIFLLALGAAVVMAILFTIIILTKESCPFIYVYNGESFEFTGEIYSGAIFPSLEREDFLPLPALKDDNGEYRLKMANQVREIQSTNLAELVVVDHPPDTGVLIDKQGNCHSFKDLRQPTSAYSLGQKDILPLIAARDSLKYVGTFTDDAKRDKDAVYLSFDRLEDANLGKLVLRAKNSFWLDYTLGSFFDLFGDKYDRWYKQRAKAKAQMQANWSLEQGIPLSVYLKRDGVWKPIDHFHVIGPMAEKDVVMPIDLFGAGTDKVELKLESGFLFWEIDYAGMDFSKPEEIYRQTVPLASAVDHEGRNVTKLLNQDDKKYFVMPGIGDQAILRYPAPEEREGCRRTVFLRSKGHYKVLRESSGTPDLAYLEQFREPGRFGAFSREKYQEAKAAFGK